MAFRLGWWRLGYGHRSSRDVERDTRRRRAHHALRPGRIRLLTPAKAGLALFLLALPTTGSSRQQAAPPRDLVASDVVASDTVEVVAGPRYAAGPLQRFLFGSGWRELWTTPIRVPILDLPRTAGGLRPVVRGGGFQTRSLEFASDDGREFRFRSVDKDASQRLSPGVRLPAIVGMVRDQTSALHPAGALVAAGLAAAAGIPHVVPTLVVMPDDPSLGQFRQEFAGMLGILEEHPAQRPHGLPDRFGFRRVVETDTLLPPAGPAPRGIDAREYLAARLLDLYLNDWDRHEGNWLWVTSDTAQPYRWLAIPKDRDQVFASYGGVVLAIARAFVPKLVPFTGDYHLKGLTANAADLDRRILGALPMTVWDSLTRVLVTRLNDAAVESALRRMPAPYYRLSRDELITKLRARRERLPAAARAWARMVASPD
ncbi:MAG TPA: hypothetical protein VHJ69_03960 [Gemmatimonadales bacterium]|nr:hypothetical protein [Gemmatimonadales bacterium]